MKVLAWLIVLDFLVIFAAMLYILALEIYEAIKSWRHARQVEKAEFIRKLKGDKNYEIVETVLNGKMRQVERRIRK